MRNRKAEEARRKKLIKLIHVARRELGMQDEDYRAMLAGMPALGGKTSSADLGIQGLELVMRALKARGFKVRSKASTGASGPGRQLANDDQSRLIRHLWLELHTDGIVRDPSEAALAHFVHRLTRVEALQWLSGAQASRIIEHLKKWRAREVRKQALLGAPGGSDEP